MPCIKDAIRAVGMHHSTLGRLFKTSLAVSSIYFHGSCDGLYMLGPGSGTIKRCGLIGGGVALLKEVCHRGVGFETPLLAANVAVSPDCSQIKI